jgi:hypothetical protein
MNMHDKCTYTGNPPTNNLEYTTHVLLDVSSPINAAMDRAI